MAVYSVAIFQGQNSQIVIYDDANGDLVADGNPRVVYNSTGKVGSNLATFGAGSSTIFVTHMDFDATNNQAIFSYLDDDGSNFTDSGLAAVKMGDASPKILSQPKDGQGNLGVFTFVLNGPRVSGDSVAPTVQVTSPNGGETANGGTQLTISFTSSDDKSVASHDINLSTDGGNSFPLVVASGLPGTATSFNYSVPAAIDTTMARIQVIAKDAGGNMGSDTSDGNFTIKKSANADTNPPMVRVTAPSAGQTLVGGASATVSFTSTDDVGVVGHNIALAIDGMNFTTTLATGIAGNAQTFQFTVPKINSSTATIRVQALDAAGNVGSAISNAFTIKVDTQAPMVRVTSPNGKEKLKGNMTFNVTFTSSDDVSIASHEIQLSIDNGASFMPLATGIPGNVQSASITVPNVKAPKSLIKVIARDAAGNMSEDVSDATFKIKVSK
jgi:hypothetical protein